MKTFLWILAGSALGIFIHLVIILTMPSLAKTTVWQKISALDSVEKITVLDDITSQSPNEFHLDPELIYGICQLDLSKGVGIITAQMPDSFWSIGIFDMFGHPVYSTTNRANLGHILQLEIFNVAQTKLLAAEKLDVPEGVLIVESKLDPLFVVIRLAPPHQAMRARYRNMIAQVICRTSP